MRRIRGLLAAGALLALLLPLFHAGITASLKYKKDTGKKCTFCHTGIPQKGDEDPQLNQDGKTFKANNYQLTEEQKRRP